MASCTRSQNAERLKQEGNTLYVQGHHQAAYERFSAAIKEDPKNAILWANRAASSIAMKRYTDASHDAEKATELDPKYAKAWLRLATSYHQLASWSQSIAAWKSGLDALPPDEKMSDQEKGFKAELERGLKRAETASRTSTLAPKAVQLNLGDAPWQRAAAMQTELEARRELSSAWVILDAYRDFKEGVDVLQKQEILTLRGQQCVKVHGGALEVLTNAILCDARVFHLTMPDFFDRYNHQVVTECKKFQGWSSAGPKIVKEQALLRLKKYGWENVRPALSTTVRAWIMRAQLHSKLQDTLSEFFENAIEIIEWGRRVWKGVPRAQRGTIFDETFLLGVKKLYLEAVLFDLQKTIDDKSILTEEALENATSIAQDILDMIERINPIAYVNKVQGGVDFSFIAAFRAYPKGHALAALGWCQSRRHEQAEETDPAARLESFLHIASLYAEAASCFAVDDEYYCYYLAISVEKLWFANAPLAMSLPPCKRIIEAAPAMRKIWENFPVARQFEAQYPEVVKFERKARELLDNGTLTMNDGLFPEGAKLPGFKGVTMDW